MVYSLKLDLAACLSECEIGFGICDKIPQNIVSKADDITCLTQSYVMDLMRLVF